MHMTNRHGTPCTNPDHHHQPISMYRILATSVFLPKFNHIIVNYRTDNFMPEHRSTQIINNNNPTSI